MPASFESCTLDIDHIRRLHCRVAHAVVVIAVVARGATVVLRVVHHNVLHRLRSPGVVIVRVASNKFHILLPTSFWRQRRRKICACALCRIIARIAGHLCDVHAHSKSHIVIVMLSSPLLVHFRLRLLFALLNRLVVRNNQVFACAYQRQSIIPSAYCVLADSSQRPLVIVFAQCLSSKILA